MSDRDDGDADTELKPCPFCGGRAEIFYNGPTKEQVRHTLSWGGDFNASFWYVKCDGCGAASIDCARKADAETVWNTRA